MEYIGKKFKHHWDENVEFLISQSISDSSHIISWIDSVSGKLSCATFTIDEIENNLSDKTWVLINE